MLEPPPGSQMLAALEETTPTMQALRAPMDPSQGYWDEHVNEAEFDGDDGSAEVNAANFNFPLLSQQVETKLPQRLEALEKEIEAHES